ncbi:MAG TPA: aminotransferase class IV [Polyangiaceae bacterium]
MTTLVSLDGKIVGPEDARVSVFDRGFLYGDSVFEALRTYGGVPFALREHLERLERSAQRALITMPVKLDVFRAEIHAVLAAAKNPESYVRLLVTRGRGSALGLDPGLALKPLRVVLVMEHKPLPNSMYERGVGVVTYRTQRVADSTPASGAKLSNYMVAVLAMDEARRAGAEEAIVLDADGRVVEGTTSNVFYVKDGVLVTPPEEAGILMGITREKILGLARRAGIAVQEKNFFPTDLVAADEAFISSSIRELAPVVTVDGKPIGKGKPGDMTLKLLALLRELAASSR